MAKTRRAVPVRRARAEPPPTRWDLAGAADGDTHGCTRILDVLDTLPRTAWLALGRRRPSAHEAGEWKAASAALDVVLDARGLAVTAWLVRDAVRTARTLAPRDVTRAASGRHRPPPDTAEERAALDAAQRAAAAAALARLARPWLSRAHLAVLVAPLRTARAVRPLQTSCARDLGA